MVPVSPPVEAILDPDSNGDSYGPLLYFTSLGFRLGTRPARVAAEAGRHGRLGSAQSFAVVHAHHTCAHGKPFGR